MPPSFVFNNVSFSAMNLSPSIAMYHGQLVALRDVSFQGPVTKLDMQEFKNVNKNSFYSILDELQRLFISYFKAGVIWLWQVQAFSYFYIKTSMVF